MIKKILKKIFVSRNERVIRKLWPIVKKVNEIYETYHHLTNEDLIKKTEEFVQRLKDGESDMEILPEAFALVKEACRRLVGKKWKITGQDYEWDMIPFDVQILGAIVLHQGKIAEMATGEGKTLVATMPLYLNSLIGRARGLKGDKRFLVNGSPRGINHLVTVNDYLARRDREWMGPVYEMLGLEVGVIQSGMEPEERKPEYNKDITYGTNNEFGFDYLRDNMVYRKEDKVQRGHIYAIVDEIDSILIDEARTPLIISGPIERTSNYLYKEAKPHVERVVKKQMLLVNQILNEAEKDLSQGKKEEAAEKILLAKKG
ncbi:MAG: preprotein translocase subunit SecA, partial [candidate division WOR-3 bacterium]